MFCSSEMNSLSAIFFVSVLMRDCKLFSQHQLIEKEYRLHCAYFFYDSFLQIRRRFEISRENLWVCFDFFFGWKDKQNFKGILQKEFLTRENFDRLMLIFLSPLSCPAY